MMSLFNELKRRNVFRVGAAYVFLGWVVVQVTDTVAPALGLPDWTLTLVLLLGLIGFPFALLFAWAFELTPQGIRRTEDVMPAESIAPSTGAKLNRIVFALMAVAIILLLADRFWTQVPGTIPTELDVAADSAPTEAGASAAGRSSIAVLPFVNMSNDPENEYFGDGLAEELLNLLAKVPELHVAARTSSFHFKDKKPTIAEVASALQVDTVLEGSVRRSGDTIRVVAQLIAAEDGSHLWSEKYDRPLTDIFIVQDEIAGHIVEALMPHLGTASPVLASTDSGDISPALFERFLWARHRYYDRSADALAEAHAEFADITRSAPAYAPAWSWLALTWLANPDKLPVSTAQAKAREAIDTALRLDPREARAQLALGDLLQAEDHIAQAESAYDQALAIDPGLVDAYIQKQMVLALTGRTEEAIAALNTARTLDPLHPDVIWNLAHLLNLQGNKREAFDTLERLYEINFSRALLLEGHLYGDSELMGRAVYVADIAVRDFSDSLDQAGRDQIAWGFLEAGLYESPVFAGSALEPLSLALSGQTGDAERLLRKKVSEDVDSTLDGEALALAFVLMGQDQEAMDFLWQRWQKNPEKKVGYVFSPYDALALTSALLKNGRVEDGRALATKLGQAISQMSPLHMRGVNWFKAMTAMFLDEPDEALSGLSRAADEGSIGYRVLGTTEAYVWPLNDDPRLAPILAKMDQNYAIQIAELQRLRLSGMSLAEARADYLAQLPRDTR